MKKTNKSLMHKAMVLSLIGGVVFTVTAGSSFAAQNQKVSSPQQSIAIEVDDFSHDDIQWEKIDSVLTEQDWETLSMKQMDEKLKAAGVDVDIFDEKDPLYNMTVSEIDALTEEQWEEIDKKHLELYGDDYFAYEEDDMFSEEEWEKIDSVLTEQDWETLSMKQMDEKLKASGIDVGIFDENDPLYNMTVSEIDALTEEQWEEIDKKHFELYGEDYYDLDEDFDDFSIEEWEKIDSVLTEQDWETLSMKQMDEKLKAAGVDVDIFDEKDPLYNMTASEIDSLTEQQWEEIEKVHDEIYGDDFDEDDLDDDEYGV